MMAQTAAFLDFPNVGSIVRCDSVKPPRWWNDLPLAMETPSLFNCALTIGKKYEVLGYEDLPRQWKAGRFGNGYSLMLVEDDDGYIVGFDPERFR